ncbi:protein eyes shut homolog [Mytilus edulis]|uniref:protein eyes shut homolog n=1 Tax=Mytilus edulis TaxID=6550 RepID=UPI0039F09D24
MNIDECKSDPCYNNATCIDRTPGWNCACFPGYTKSVYTYNKHVLDVDECQSDPCYNNATCIDRTPGWNCACLPGYTGKQCQIAINECTSNPCRNNGTCVDLINGYRCHCSNDSTGQHCEHRMNHCSSHPCLHDGTCMNNYDGFKCECIDSWFGDICEERHTNESEGCSVLEYSECSCFTQQSKQSRKSNKMLLGSIGYAIGLLLTILSYCAWMMLNKSKSDSKIHPHEATILQHEVFQESEIAKKPAQSSHRVNKLHEARLRKQKQQKEHHNCFLDHSGFDFSKLYVNEDGSRKILKCRHQRVQNDS